MRFLIIGGSLKDKENIGDGYINFCTCKGNNLGNGSFQLNEKDLSYLNAIGQEFSKDYITDKYYEEYINTQIGMYDEKEISKLGEAFLMDYYIEKFDKIRNNFVYCEIYQVKEEIAQEKRDTELGTLFSEMGYEKFIKEMTYGRMFTIEGENMVLYTG